MKVNLTRRRTTVGAVAEVTSGPAFKSSHFGAAGNGTPLLRGDNIVPGALRWENHRTWPTELLPGYEHLLVDEGDIILAMDRPVVAAGLKLARARASDTGALLVQRVARVRPHGVDGAFLYYALQQHEFQRHVEGAGVGTQIPHITLRSIREFAVVLPPRDEQHRLVDVLEDHLSRLDAGLDQLRSARRRSNSLRESVLRQELLGRACGSERSQHRLLMADVDDGELQDLPAGWRWQRLHEVADVVGGVTKDASKQADPSFVEVPYLRVANVQRGRLDLRVISRIRVPPAKLEQLRLQPGDVLLNEGGDRDKLGRGWVWSGEVADCITQNHVFRARPRRDVIHPKLLSWSANTLGGPWCERNGKQSVNLASISLKRIRLMPVPVPPLDMQQGMVGRLERVHEHSARLTAAIDGQLARAAGLRRSLLSAAFSGRL